MYDDSYVPGFEDSEAVSAHGGGWGWGSWDDTSLFNPSPQFWTLKKTPWQRGSARKLAGGSLGKWGAGPS